MRFYDKVIFELLLVAVVNKVDAGIDALVSDSRIGGNVSERCPTAKVMNLAELLVLSTNRGARVGIHQTCDH
jgi:hypothetical protein